VRIVRTCSLATLHFAIASASAQDLNSQSSIWATKPVIAAFKSIEHAHLAAAQHASAALVAAKAPRSSGNTPAAYDEAVRHINAASNFASLMKEVHRDARLPRRRHRRGQQSERCADSARAASRCLSGAASY